MLIRFWGTRGSLPAPLGTAGLRRKLVRALRGAAGRRLDTEEAVEQYVAQELDFALAAGILCFNVESEPELELLSARAATLGKVAPISLRSKILALIAEQGRRAAQGEVGRIFAKLNALVDPEVIKALYRASCDGAQTNTSGLGLKTTTQPGAGDCGHCAWVSIPDVTRMFCAVWVPLSTFGELTRQVGGGW